MGDSLIVMRNGHLIDPRSETIQEVDIVIEAGRIGAVDEHVVAPSHARTIDLAGRFVLPGLIDAHAHVGAVSADYDAMMDWPMSYLTARSVRVMSDMLSRGFTTIRDLGGADHGMARAIDERVLVGPRLRFSGKNLSRAEGPGHPRDYGNDYRPKYHERAAPGVACQTTAALLEAAQVELDRGAHQLKVSVTGGVSARASGPASIKFSEEELSAVVDLARAAGRYVAGHVYSSEAIQLALRSGIRSIEHGNFLDADCLPLFLSQDAYLVPTLITYSALAEHGHEYGLTGHVQEKIVHARDAGLAAVELAHRAGVPIAFGSDLMGTMHALQNEEFRLRAEVLPAAEILRSATVTAAELLNMRGLIGEVVPGAYADLIVVDDDPLDDVTVLCRPRDFGLIMKEGHVHHLAI